MTFGLMDSFGKSIGNATIHICGQFREAVQPLIKSFEGVPKTLNIVSNASEAVNDSASQVSGAAQSHRNVCDICAHGIIGGLIGGAISSMTGMGALMPIGALVGIGIGYDFNKFSNGALRRQHNKKPEEQSSLILAQQYVKFRFTPKAWQKKEAPEPEVSVVDDATQKLIAEAAEAAKVAKEQVLGLVKEKNKGNHLGKLLALPGKLNISDIISNSIIDEEKFKTVLENHDDWKALTQEKGSFWGHAEIFNDNEKLTLKNYIRAEIQKLHNEPPRDCD